MHITKVQQWVAAMLVFVVGAGVSIPLAIASAFMEHEDFSHSDRVGLWAMSGVFGVVTIAGMLVVHRRSALSPCLLLGLIPPAVAYSTVF